MTFLSIQLSLQWIYSKVLCLFLRGIFHWFFSFGIFINTQPQHPSLFIEYLKFDFNQTIFIKLSLPIFFLSWKIVFYSRFGLSKVGCAGKFNSNSLKFCWDFITKVRGGRWKTSWLNSGLGISDVYFLNQILKTNKPTMSRQVNDHFSNIY